MKTLFIAAVVLTSSAVHASCSIYSEKQVPAKLEALLKKKGYALSADKSATYRIDIYKYELVDTQIIIQYGDPRLLEKRWGYATEFDLFKNNKFQLQVYGESVNFLANEYFVPSESMKAKSEKRAIRKLKRILPEC